MAKVFLVLDARIFKRSFNINLAQAAVWFYIAISTGRNKVTAYFSL